MIDKSYCKNTNYSQGNGAYKDVEVNLRTKQVQSVKNDQVQELS